MKLHICLFIFSFFSIQAILQAQEERPLVQKEPAWVTAHTIDYSKTGLDDEAEDGYVNIDYEKQVSLFNQSVYYKKSIRILSEAGVQNRSEINIDFDPSYNQLIFHTIRIIREGAVINKLQLSKIRLIHQEPELKRFLYNGLLTAVLFLEDVRKGDIIEYSYTVKGFNPVFKNRYSDELPVGFSVPLYNLHYKVIVPKGREVEIKTSLSELNCKTQESKSDKTFEWDLDQIKPLRIQDETPSWYDPYNTIIVSEYKNWKEVNEWALDLFRFSLKTSPALQKKIDGWNELEKTPEKKILAALRFVQDDIRYMGIEMGKNSHQPNPPDKVFNQRFGDCKDKSYLLCTMLRGMGIDANPVLINTEYKKTLLNVLPAPTVFDHVTVRVSLNNKFYWFDPTISYQRGGIDDISYPDYQCGLVISSSTTSLTNIPQQDKGMVDIHELFRIPDLKGGAHLTIKTVFSGSFADETRNDFHNSSVYEMQKRYKDYYTNYYERLSSDSLTYADNEQTGEFTTSEYYTVQNMWQRDGNEKKGYFAPYIINDLLRKPQDARRTMPFEIAFPAHYKDEVEVDLPDDWDVEQSEQSISCSAFKLRTQFYYYNRKLKLQYEYQSLKDHVPAEETNEFMESYSKADQSIQYALTLPAESGVKTLFSSKKNETTLRKTYIFALLILLIVAGAWWSRKL